MPTLRESIGPIVLIMIASMLVMFAIAPLDSSEWAEGVRADFLTEGGEDEPFADGEGPPGILLIIGPLLKITFLMGIPGLITLGILRLVRRFGKRSPAGAAPS